MSKIKKELNQSSKSKVPFNVFRKPLTFILAGTMMLGTAGLMSGCKDGQTSAVWYKGTDYATVKDAKNGDFFIDTDDYKLYQREDGSWQLLMDNFGKPGTNGQAGANGENGQPGANGASWTTGEGIPTMSIGQTGDLYLNTVTGDVYLKGAQGWGNPITNLKGATGSNGAAGENGTDGATWHTGENAPTIDANAGDLYLDTLTGNVYKKGAQGWGNPIANIKGATGSNGAAGENGTDGATWYTGENAPTIDANINDLYLDTLTGDVYKKNAQGWDLISNIKGETGETITVTNVSVTSLDEWGIRVKFTFDLSDNSKIETEFTNFVNTKNFYPVANAEDVAYLNTFGINRFEVSTELALASALNLNDSYVKLVDEITTVSTITINSENSTLDLNGHNVIFNPTVDDTAAFVNNGNLKIKDSAQTDEVAGYITRIAQSYYLIINEGTLTIESGGFGIMNEDVSSVIINNKDCNAVNPATLVIDGGFFSSNASNAIKNDEYGILEINDGFFMTENENHASVMTWGVATINGGYFSGVGQALTVAAGTFGGVKETNTTIINGGNFDMPIAVLLKNGDGYNANTQTLKYAPGIIDLTINGGNFYGAISDSKTCTIQETDSLNINVEYVKVVANSQLMLQTAIDNGLAVSLGSDITTTSSIVVNEGLDIELDLNGHNLVLDTDAKKTPVVLNNGNLRILDNGNNPEMGTITRTDNSKYYIIVNEGNLTINNGNICNENADDDSSVIINNKDCEIENAAFLMIEGGNFKSVRGNAVKNDEYGNININGGNFVSENSNYAALQNWANANITGGYFQGAGQAISVEVYNGQTNNTTISGGTFDMPTAIYLNNGYNAKYETGTINLDINGGEFMGIITESQEFPVLETDSINISVEGLTIVAYGEELAKHVQND